MRFTKTVCCVLRSFYGILGMSFVNDLYVIVIIVPLQQWCLRLFLFHPFGCIDLWGHKAWLFGRSKDSCPHPVSNHDLIRLLRDTLLTQIQIKDLAPSPGYAKTIYFLRFSFAFSFCIGNGIIAYLKEIGCT